jgi:phosphoserine aminotransferase
METQRLHNFNAGPAALPREVLETAQQELLNYQGTGLSVLEMSHRSAAYQEIIDATEASLRRLLGLDERWAVLFLQGGATLEFAGVPLNLMRTGRAGYVVSGHFAQKAQEEAARYGKSLVLASSESTGFDRIPSLEGVEAAAAGCDYVYICQNNTIFGTTFSELPACGDTPLVADVSSMFLGCPLDVERYGVIYAGAQKNAGPAGTCVVCVRRELVEGGPALAACPTYLNWELEARKGSMYNTPNTFGIYMSGLVFDWIERQGGLAAMEARNRAKAQVVYDALDASDVLHGTAEKCSRSFMNVTFTSGTPELDAEFLSMAAAAHMTGLKGHRLVGGMRASLYNAVTLEEAQLLAALIDEFGSTHTRAESH